MTRIGLLSVAVFVVNTLTAHHAGADQISFDAPDGVAVFADFIPPDNTAQEDAPLVVLFHQARSNAQGEYASIVLRLRSAGYGVLAVDLRSGGELFSGHNRTWAGFAELPAEDQPGYCDAYQDLDAAVDWAINWKRSSASDAPIILWGSSYSAGLVLQRAALNGDGIAGVLAFSPASGEPMAGCDFSELIDQIQVPAIAFRPSGEMNYAQIVEQTTLLREHDIPVRIVANGSHGSSMLVPGRGDADLDDAWGKVNAFLAEHAMPPGQRVEIQSGEFVLIGDLQLPGQAPRVADGVADGATDSHPAAILLHGAGDTRDSYRQLALTFAQQGIASLRVDLRGHGESVNAGQFIPSDASTHVLLDQAAEDIAQTYRWLDQQPRVTTKRVAAVTASYSAQAAAQAIGEGVKIGAVIALSPGSLSDQTIAAMDQQRWLLLRAAQERNSIDAVFAMIAKQAPNTTVITTPGRGHGTGLLSNNPWANGRIVSWLTGHTR